MLHRTLLLYGLLMAALVPSATAVTGPLPETFVVT